MCLFRESLYLASLSAAIHCYYTGTLFRCEEGYVFYNVLIISQFFSGPVSLAYDLHKCYFSCTAFSQIRDTGKLEGVEVRE